MCHKTKKPNQTKHIINREYKACMQVYTYMYKISEKRMQ